MAFFKDLGNKITNVSGNAISRVQDFSSSVVIRSKIADEEKNINNAYMQIGKLYCEKHAGDYEPEFASFFQVVGNCRKRIEEYNVQLTNMHEQDHCEKCGAELIKGNSVCPMCGFDNKKETAEPDTLPCPRCGKPVKKGQRFCVSCGARLEE